MTGLVDALKLIGNPVRQQPSCSECCRLVSFDQAALCESRGHEPLCVEHAERRLGLGLEQVMPMPYKGPSEELLRALAVEESFREEYIKAFSGGWSNIQTKNNDLSEESLKSALEQIKAGVERAVTAPRIAPFDRMIDTLRAAHTDAVVHCEYARASHIRHRIRLVLDEKARYENPPRYLYDDGMIRETYSGPRVAGFTPSQLGAGVYVMPPEVVAGMDSSRAAAFLEDRIAGHVPMSGTVPKPELGSRESVRHSEFPVQGLAKWK